MSSTSSNKPATEPAAADWAGPRIDFTDFATCLAARRAELGQPELPRNAGKRRTPSKRALLDAIEATGKRW